MRDRVAGVGADRHLERGACLLVLLLLCVEDGEVVVRLGQFRVVLGQALEDRDRVGAAAHFGEDHPAREASLRILGLRRQVGVDLGQRLRQLLLSDQFLRIRQVVGQRDRGSDGKAETGEEGGEGQWARRARLRGGGVHRYGILCLENKPVSGWATAKSRKNKARAVKKRLHKLVPESLRALPNDA